MSDAKLEAAFAKLRNKKNYMTENSTFPFGKYKGETVGYVLEWEPSYIVWWDEEVDKPCIRPDLVTDAEFAAEEEREDVDAPWDTWR